jgi:L-aminopeptidase/D-esterase-like protein
MPGRPGPLNLIVDVAGLAVGHADDPRLKSGVTVVIPDDPAVASVAVHGGAPGTRDTDLLAPDQTVDRVHALVLSGGSAFGLDAAGGVQALLAEQGRGFAIGSARVPIVPQAVCFDLLNGGDKAWGRFSPYRAFGYAAAAAAGPGPFALGTIGAGTGATLCGPHGRSMKGGLGSASAVLASGVTVGALVVVNALGSATVGDGPHFWAAPFEEAGEFGGLGFPARIPDEARLVRTKLGSATAGANTTIAVVATDAALTKAEAKRLAVMAHDGLARALWPAHTPFDGDSVFALSTGRRPLVDPPVDLIDIGAVAAATLARAIARGVYAATPAPGDLAPTWAELFGGPQ